MSRRNVLFATSAALLAILIGIWTNHNLNHRSAPSVDPVDPVDSSLAHQYGLLVLATGVDPVVDVVAIHGLDGHPIESWTATNGKLWLRDFLPDKIPHARIMSYGYDAYTRNRQQLSDQTIYDHAEALVAALASRREETNTQRRPIIFVAHSLGGLVLKYAMVHAHLCHKNDKFHHKSVELSTYGIMFLGTPHEGTDSTELASLLLGIQSIYTETNNAVLQDLRLHSPRLQQQLSQYSPISRNYKTKFFFEMYDTLLFGGYKKRLVPKFSAVVPGATDAESIPLHKDHVGMSKFETGSDGDFQTIASHLFNMVTAAPLAIGERWKSYDRHEDMARKEQAGEEIMKLADSVALNKLPYSDGTSYISDNACLTGTRTALIDSMLMWIKSADRTKGAEIYYLTGAAGVGKTTIAHSIAQRCEEEGLLMSSFFFDGRVAGRNSPTMLFSTIARNLADKNTAFRQEIVHTLEQRRSLAGATIPDHFRELILRPSGLLRDAPVVIIIDALDESQAQGLEHVLKVLRDQVPKLPETFRVLLTARNTPDLDFYLSDQAHVRRLSIDTSEQTNLHDISVYSQYKLRDIAQRKRLGGDWPDPQLLHEFISKSNGLFVWVFVIYEHLLLSVNPDKQLKSLLSTSSPPNTSPEIAMDKLYLEILGKCSWTDNDFVDGYHLIMGAIMAAKMPLSISALQSLHRHSLTFSVSHILKPLESLLTGVISTNDSMPVQILHLSLKDFLTARAQSSPDSRTFALDETEHSQRLALLSLVVLNEDLQQTGLAMGYLAETESKGIPQIGGDLVSEHLLYACRFWMDHLIVVEHPESELVDALRTFLSAHIVTWMELVSATGKFDGISNVRAWIEKKLPSDSNMTSAITGDNVAQSLLRLSSRLSYMARREEALTAAKESVKLYRSLAKQRPTAFNPNLATALNYLAISLTDVGHREEALRTIKQCVELYQSLAKQDMRFMSELAVTLNNLAMMLSELGHREESLRAAEQSIALYRSLTKLHPTAFNSDLAMALNNHAQALSQLERQDEALRAVKESVGLYRSLAKQDPETFNYHLAGVLNTRAKLLSALGHQEEALRFINESVELYRSLAKQRPSAFNPDLVKALGGLTIVLTELGHREESLRVSKEAVKLCRSLAKQHPSAFNPDLANSLSHLASGFSQLGYREEARNAIEESVELHRSLAKQRPARFNPELANALSSLGTTFSHLGYQEKALKAVEESVELYQSLAKQHFAAFASHLAQALHTLSATLSGLKRSEEALNVIQESIKLYRSLAKQHPAAFTPDLALALSNLAIVLSELGHQEEALRVIKESVKLYRPLAKQRPDAFNPNLANALSNLAITLHRLGYNEDALRVVEESVELSRSLAKQHPTAFLPDLAMALNTLSAMHSELQHHEEALMAVEESIRLFQSLAKQHPVVFKPKIAMALENRAAILSARGPDEEAS